MKYKALRERHRIVVRRCMEAEEIVTASNIVYDQLDVRLEETVKENKKLEERLRQSDKEIERVKEQSLRWCSDYIEKDHAMQAQADDHAGVVNALCDKVKDSQEEIARLDAVVVMQRQKLESFDDTWQAIRETTVKHSMASEKKYNVELKGKGKRTVSEGSDDDAEMHRRREDKRAE
jgi:hypothetical protein